MIHNAGVIDGADLVAVNVVAPFVLTAMMNPPRRVIVLSSSMHRSGSPRQVAEGVTGTRAISYSDSKLYVTALAMGVSRRWPTVLAHAVDPGWVPTRMGGRSAPDDLTEGHRTQEWLATAPASELHARTGGYWHRRRIQQPRPAAFDVRFEDELIDSPESRTGVRLPRQRM